MRIEIHPDYIKYEDFLKSIPTIFKNEGKIIYNKRNCVKLFSFDGADFVVKKYKSPNIVQSISYSFFKKSKAERAFIYADYFKNNGISTPQGICFIEIKKHLLLTESYFVSAVCNMPSLMSVLNCDDFDQTLARELATFLVYMHSKGILHGDLNLTNILF
jgi:Lipopolysaccharide kinase (Kdo/WaaP) family.